MLNNIVHIHRIITLINITPSLPGRFQFTSTGYTLQKRLLHVCLVPSWTGYTLLKRLLHVAHHHSSLEHHHTWASANGATSARTLGRPHRENTCSGYEATRDGA